MASSAKKRRRENSSSPDYSKCYSRVSKDNLYMIIALWMEDFVDDAPKSHRKVGAVLVLPNEVIFAADCSRDGVHAVARLLMKHHDKAQGCNMFMSRKPCPFCAKLLVQSNVKRVLFLPREPEYYLNDVEKNEQHMKEVDHIFTASVIAQIRFVLAVKPDVLADLTRKSGKKESEIERQIKDVKDNLTGKYGFSPQWIDSIKNNLPWSAFDDKMKSEVLQYFDNAMDWMARAIALRKRELNFEPAIEKTESTNGLDDEDAFDPVNKTAHARQARHFMTIARFLAERTDDPKTGVGAVVVSRAMEILAFGWNGFPLKAPYGEFPRASDDDAKSSTTGTKPEEKYPYVIHAEQNALLMRNKKDIEGAILFVTKSPCNECTPLIAMEGIKIVVVDDVVLARTKKRKGTLGYKEFPRMVSEGKFVCFQTRRRLRRSPRNPNRR